jgi:hypothetical protein
MTQGIGYKEIVEGLIMLGVKKRDTLLVHSSLRAFGYVDGGSNTIVPLLPGVSVGRFFSVFGGGAEIEYAAACCRGNGVSTLSSLQDDSRRRSKNDIRHRHQTRFCQVQLLPDRYFQKLCKNGADFQRKRRHSGSKDRECLMHAD